MNWNGLYTQDTERLAWGNVGFPTTPQIARGDSSL